MKNPVLLYEVLDQLQLTLILRKLEEKGIKTFVFDELSNSSNMTLFRGAGVSGTGARIMVDESEYVRGSEVLKEFFSSSEIDNEFSVVDWLDSWGKNLPFLTKVDKQIRVLFAASFWVVIPFLLITTLLYYVS